MTLTMIIFALLASTSVFVVLIIIDRPLKQYQVNLKDEFHQNLLANRLERTMLEWHAQLSGYDLACIQSYEKARLVDERNANPLSLMLGTYEPDKFSKQGSYLVGLREKMLADTKSGFYQQ